MISDFDDAHYKSTGPDVIPLLKIFETSNDGNVDKFEDNPVVATVTSCLNINCCLAWLSMGMAIIAGGTIGPVFKYMEVVGNITPCLAASWRYYLN